jgi:3-hydroxy-9,10-secoandrosta-1,3,5(10)-triene-9,17-dione monooxygenase
MDRLDVDRGLVELAATLVPSLRERAPATDRARRLPQESVDALTEAGLFRLSAPRRLGGLQADHRTTLEVVAELARGCGSTAWVTAVLNSAAWLVGLYPERAQRDVYGQGPGARIATVPAPRGSTAVARRAPGGVVVTGRWDSSSGCLHADWLVMGAAVVGDDATRSDALLLLPASEATIRDTWYTAGLRGTGSNTVLAHEVFVPDHRTLPWGDALQDRYRTEHAGAESLYRSAFAPTLTLMLVGPLLGLTQAALEAVVERAPRRGITFTVYEKQADATVTHLQLAEAVMKVDCARLLAHRAAAALDGAAEQGRRLEVRDRVQVRADVGYATRLCREAVEILVSAGGASGMAEQSAIQRIWRDVTTASVHALLQPTTSLELLGRVVVGLEPAITPLV